MEISDNKWIDIIGIERARVFEALPIGREEEGSLVIACGEVSKKGLDKAMKKLRKRILNYY